MGNPNYRFNDELADLAAHVRVMDRAGIDNCSPFLRARGSISQILVFYAL
jgi:hypothetical protein